MLRRRPTILIADDHVIFLEGIRRVLEEKVTLLGTASNGLELLEAEQRFQPDVIVLDVSMPVLNGLEAARELRSRGSHSRLIFLSMHGEKEVALQAFRAGAMGYVMKTCAREELAHAIQEVMEDRIYVSRQISQGDLFSFEQARRLPRKEDRVLTMRETEVLQLVSEGKALKEIAGILSVAVRTVVFHKSNIMDKLGIRTTAELTKYAVRHQVVVV